MSDVFKLLFQDNDAICTGDFTATRVYTQPAAPQAEFFSINPLSLDKDYVDDNGAIRLKKGRGRRADLNVTKFQNFLFEIDAMPLDEQLNFWNSLDVPIASLVYSGGKSYHCIISLKEPLDAEPHTKEGISKYKDTWTALAAHLAQLGNKDVRIFDTSCKNPSRLSRYPGATRANGSVQTLIKLGVLAPASFLQEAVSRVRPRERQVIEPTQQTASSEQEFRLMAPVELVNKLKFPKVWAASAGMYPELLKLTLWAIDATNIAKADFMEYLNKYTVPGLLEAGYPRSKIKKPVDDAYRMKRSK